MSNGEPSFKNRLHFDRPSLRWDEGLPCGNGMLGLLVWGDGHPLNLSIDRHDLWDNRPDPHTRQKGFRWKTLIDLLERNDMAAISSQFEFPPDDAVHPTKLPCGRITLDFKNGGISTFESVLDMRSAVTTTTFGRERIKAFVHAEKPLIIVQGNRAPPRVRFLSPFDQSRKFNRGGEAALGPGDTSKLGYPPPQSGLTSGGINYVRQKGAEDMSYIVAWRLVEKKKGWSLFINVEQNIDGKDPLGQAQVVLDQAVGITPGELERSHTDWWAKYWHLSAIEIPDPQLQILYQAEIYKLGSIARKNCPPISLQGVWTADEMSLPPWRGDYHHDLNTQMSYWPVHTANRLEQSEGLNDALTRWLPYYQRFARDYFDSPGAFVPVAQALGGEMIPGWAAYTFSRTNGAWLAQHLWLHYRYTMDEDFLRKTGYPFISEIARFVASQVKADEQGIYHIYYSSSPEFYNNWRESFATDSTYDLSLIRYILEIASAAARILLVNRFEAKQWDRIRAALQPYHISPENPRLPAPEGGLAVWKGHRLTESHRHLSHCMPIFPLGDLNIEGSDADRQLIQNTLSELESMGTGFWCGYSYAWMACIGARIREPRRALWALKQYVDGFISPNTFHLNGDFKRLGSSRFHYRPFTLEGGFGAAEAIQEMLLQSWGGRIRLFPAVPEEWRDVRFHHLRAEGAFVISAQRRRGEFHQAEILSEKGTDLAVDCPQTKDAVFTREAGQKKWTRHAAGKNLVLRTKPGGRYIFSAKPK